MNLYQHFACYTRLPIRLKDVRGHLLETGVASSIRYVPVNSMEPAVLRGFALRFKYRDGKPPGIHARIFFSTKLPPAWQRVVIAKELTHLTDVDGGTASTRDMVSELIREMGVPPSLAQSLPGRMDHAGLLHALCILLPRDAIHEIRPKHASGLISDEAIAAMARLPPEFFPFLLSKDWENIIEKII